MRQVQRILGQWITSLGSSVGIGLIFAWKQTGEARRLQAQAEEAGETRTAIAALRELTRLVELKAKMAGQLKDQQVNVLHVRLDEVTAARMAATYLSRRKLLEVSP